MNTVPKMTIPSVLPTRKQRFGAALKLLGVTQVAWCELQGCTVTHLNLVLGGKRPGGRQLNAAIDEWIERGLGKDFGKDPPVRRPRRAQRLA